MVSGAWHQYPLNQIEAMREALAGEGFEFVVKSGGLDEAPEPEGPLNSTDPPNLP